MGGKAIATPDIPTPTTAHSVSYSQLSPGQTTFMNGKDRIKVIKITFLTKFGRRVILESTVATKLENGNYEFTTE